MGALIITRGTRRLAGHYNEEFSSWLTFYKNRINVFDRAGRDIDVWDQIIQVVTDPRPGIGHTERADNLTLLPKDNPAHPNLHRRWRFFLKNDLTQANRNKLADAIYAALKLDIAYIVFDVVHGAQQDIDFDPNGLDEGSRFARITIIVTRAMAAAGGGNEEFPRLDAPSADPTDNQAP
ncbi:hypothetical protein I6F35_26415 [Bradyrhizobium sp. BRP22]|uniref:hypothetical protein n=1 Tax=Bradyrhizobium sp. BRP22 TaxID=2793821 RepID=UPI001CD2C052|nr:hypothetical protein [Bradyrhizobium sp. BRP22]MCA1456708.1 hypothetical protein [Bradyrhizobium sp. BRP22]